MVTTQAASKPYESLSTDKKSSILALSILMGRIDSLPKADRAEAFELLAGLAKTEDPEEKAGIIDVLEEILVQEPIHVASRPVELDKPMAPELKDWSKFVGKKIRDLREEAGLTQVQLAEKAGIPQSHVSRLENTEHSPTHKTLVKLAMALNVPIGTLDPSSE